MLDDLECRRIAEQPEPGRWCLTVAARRRLGSLVELNRVVDELTTIVRPSDEPNGDAGHGSEKTFRAGCRCERCVQAQRERNHARRVATPAPGQAPVKTWIDESRRVAGVHRARSFRHGTASSYRIHGCRCPVCVEAHRDRVNQEVANRQRPTIRRPRRAA